MTAWRLGVGKQDDDPNEGGLLRGGLDHFPHEAVDVADKDVPGPL
jgi:hypothetical protein